MVGGTETATPGVVTIIATLRWASCGPGTGPQDPRVAIIVTTPGGIHDRVDITTTRLTFCYTVDIQQAFSGFYFPFKI